MMSFVPLHPLLFEDTVRQALKEDLGRAGELTTDALIPADVAGEGALVARKPGCIAGLDVALTAFRLVDPAVDCSKQVADGADVEAGQPLATLRGQARSLLTAERTALNFLGCLSGVATATRRMVRQIDGHRARIVCTRKTLPGLRALQKYAVRAGGGGNHRFGLDDAVLIKDNHLAVCGGVAEAVRRARAHAGHLVKIEIEVDTLAQLAEVLKTDADVVLLDNMTPDQLRRAVAMVDGRLIVEASGNVTPETVADIAATGVDCISAGFLTHSAPNLDVALDLCLDPRH